jgi:hypothetical protein
MAQVTSPDPDSLAHWFVDDIPPSSSPIRFRAGLLQVYDLSVLTTFHFLRYRTYVCPPPTFPMFNSRGYPIPATLLPRYWPLAPLLRPGSKSFPLNSSHPTSPEPTSASTDTHYPPFSHLSSPRRCCRVPGGLFDLSQCGENKVRVVALGLIHLRHFTALQVHPTSRQVRCTRSSNYGLCMQQRLYKNFNEHWASRQFHKSQTVILQWHCVWREPNKTKRKFGTLLGMQKRE